MSFPTLRGYVENDDVMEWFALCADALLDRKKAVARALRETGSVPASMQIPALLQMTIGEVEQFYEDSLREIELAAVLWLMTHCEGRLRADFAKRLADLADSSYLRHRFQRLDKAAEKTFQVPLAHEGIVDCWKEFMKQVLVAPTRDDCVARLGAIKPMLLIRHWLAHGRYWNQGSATAIDLPTANLRVTRFFEALAETAAAAAVSSLA